MLSPVVYESIFKSVQKLVDMKVSIQCTIRTIGYLPELFKKETFWKLPTSYILWLITGLNYILQDSYASISHSSTTRNERASRFRCLWSDAINRAILRNATPDSAPSGNSSGSKESYDEIIYTFFDIFDVFYKNLEQETETPQMDEDFVHLNTKDPLYEDIYFEVGKLFTNLLKPGMTLVSERKESRYE